jgi:hypothetical protein
MTSPGTLLAAMGGGSDAQTWGALVVVALTAGAFVWRALAARRRGTIGCGGGGGCGCGTSLRRLKDEGAPTPPRERTGDRLR